MTRTWNQTAINARRACEIGEEALREEVGMSEKANRLHQQIMNLGCETRTNFSDVYTAGYKFGHRDARHAAAELSQSVVADLERVNADLLAIAQAVVAGGMSYPKYLRDKAAVAIAKAEGETK